MSVLPFSLRLVWIADSNNTQATQLALRLTTLRVTPIFGCAGAMMRHNSRME
jgi:hypothetical protein